MHQLNDADEQSNATSPHRKLWSAENPSQPPPAAESTETCLGTKLTKLSKTE